MRFCTQNFNLFYKTNSKQLSIVSDHEINNLNLIISDINGKIIKSIDQRNIRESNWSLIGLPKGFYIARVKANDKIKILKFVIN